jgi:hypothetical protein
MKIVCLVDKPPLNCNQVYEGIYFSYHTQSMLNSYYYEGYDILIDEKSYRIEWQKHQEKKAIPLADFRESQINTILE